MHMEMAAKQLEIQKRQTAIAEMRAQTNAAQAKISIDAEKATASYELQSDNQEPA